MHESAPEVGKLKSGMVRVLIELYSRSGDVVLDPFCGAGVVPLECVIMGCPAVANDLSPYAYVITRGKLSAPFSKQEALREAEGALRENRSRVHTASVDNVPDWVHKFFHPDTLKEIVTAFQVLEEKAELLPYGLPLGYITPRAPRVPFLSC